MFLTPCLLYFERLFVILSEEKQQLSGRYMSHLQQSHQTDKKNQRF